MSVTIWPSSFDYNKTSGLCGNFDSNRTNDGDINWDKFPEVLSETDLQSHRFVSKHFSIGLFALSIHARQCFNVCFHQLQGDRHK